MSAIAVFDEVRKVFSDSVFARRPVRALAGISLSIGPNEVVGILGPNRAGKTTLIKILLSLCRPSAGRVLRFGRPSSDRSTLGRVGYIHESPAFPQYLSATELLEYYGALSLLPEPIVRERTVQLLNLVGLTDRGSEPIARFSKGMIQRLALAQALLNDPELLVLDEPAEGLDLLGRQLVHEVIQQQRQRGRSVLLVSHSGTDVEILCDRLAIVVNGSLVFLGPLRDLLGSPGRGQTLASILQKLYAGANV